MVDPPALHCVKLALPLEFQAGPHVLQIISSFLLPNTSDGAIYNNLQRVRQAHEPFRAWTVGAMDGAAARGRVSLLQRLRSNRSEGYSTAVFVAQHPTAVSTLSSGYISIIRRSVVPLKNSLRLQDMINYEWWEAGAANGHVGVVEYFHSRTYNAAKPLLAAAANGHVAVLRLLIERHTLHTFQATLVKPALKMAAQGGHAGVMELLLGGSRRFDLADELVIASSGGHRTVVELLLLRGNVAGDKIVQALVKAVNNGHNSVVQPLLDRLPRTDGVCISPVSGNCETKPAMSPTQTILERAFLSAVGNGRVDLVRLLTSRISMPVSRALVRAARTRQLKVLELLLDISQGLEDPYYP
ncbi:hypothetical protein PHYPSEUDO_011108 [Phytophthora pseudosyringae]|uniref:Uncharacterized protein n=1 Tax=Phytophthora pseudosyringae TaxID=221518 RepID=A0A8T1WAD3_9STRA|nr:hypothetical protein PHYPSEUDO_011108 [Phytophthora pseudosyringae]